MKPNGLMFVLVTVVPYIATAQDRIGCLFVNNDEIQNTIEQFAAFDDGSLLFQGRIETGGTGATGGYFSSQRIVVTADQMCLMASNPLNNSISAFTIDASNCTLTPAGPPVPTGQFAGINGMGLAIEPDIGVLYAANPVSNSIVGFTIGADCTLTSIGDPTPGPPGTMSPGPIQVLPPTETGGVTDRRRRLKAGHLDNNRHAVYSIGDGTPAGTLTPDPTCYPCPSPRGPWNIAGADSDTSGNLIFEGKIVFNQTVVAVFDFSTGVPMETKRSPYAFTSGSNSNVVKLADKCLMVTNQQSNTLTRLRVVAGGDLSQAGQPFVLPFSQFPTGMVFGCQNTAGNYPMWIAQWNPSQIVASQWNGAECGLVSAITIYPSGSPGSGHLLNGLVFVPTDGTSCILPSRDVPPASSGAN